jgi:hypothetical protein
MLKGGKQIIAYQMKGRYRLIADIQEQKVIDPKRSFKVGIASTRSSAIPVIVSIS